MNKRTFIIIILVVIMFAISGCILKKADPKIKEIKKRGKLIVGTFSEFVPFTSREGDKYVGYDIDLIEEIAKRMGVKVEFQEIFFLDLFPAVEKNEIDLAISGITITPARQKNVLFSDPYINVGQVLVVKKDNEEIKGKEDADGKKIGTTKGTTLEESAKRLTDPSLVFVYDDLKEVIALEEGEVDVLVRDYVEALSLVKEKPHLKIAGDPFQDDYYGIMTNKENTGLIDEINRILGDLSRENKLKQLKLKWLGE